MNWACGRILLVLLFLASPLEADNERFLDGLGLQFNVISPRVVRVLPYPDQRLWLNGADVYTHDPSHEGYDLRVGDVVDECEMGVFHRYRFIKLDGTVATFTCSTYQAKEAYLGDGQTRLSSGRLIRSESVTVDLARYEIVDWDPTLYVESMEGRVYHSKAR